MPDREIATVEAWFAEHPEIKILSRDRGGDCGKATAKASPNATHVADRWHLMENASAAFLDAVRKLMRAIRSALGATTIDPVLLTCAEKLQYECYSSDFCRTRNTSLRWTSFRLWPVRRSGGGIGQGILRQNLERYRRSTRVRSRYPYDESSACSIQPPNEKRLNRRNHAGALTFAPMHAFILAASCAEAGHGRQNHVQTVIRILHD